MNYGVVFGYASGGVVAVNGDLAGQYEGMGSFADPYVFEEGGKWYMTSTYSARGVKHMLGSLDNCTYESKVYEDASGLYLVYVGRLADGDNHIMVGKLKKPDEADESFKLGLF